MSSLYPLMTVSRLLKSWATPPASRPTASIFCNWRNCSSIRLRSVTSDHEPTASTGSPAASRRSRSSPRTQRYWPSRCRKRNSLAARPRANQPLRGVGPRPLGVLGVKVPPPPAQCAGFLGPPAEHVAHVLAHPGDAADAPAPDRQRVQHGRAGDDDVL